MNLTAPDVRNLTRGGAIYLFQPLGITGYLDLGNIPDFTQTLSTNFLEHFTVRSGLKIKDRREKTDNGLEFKMSLDEMNAANMNLVVNGSGNAIFSQSSGTAVVVTIINPTLGLSFFLGAYRVTNCVVTVTETTKVAGVDYAVEADLGVIRILPTGSILATDTVTVTFNKPALTGDVTAPLTNATVFQGASLIYFRTSDGRLWVWNPTNSQLSFTGDLAFSGDAYAKVTADSLILPDYSNAAHPFGQIIQLPST